MFTDEWWWLKNTETTVYKQYIICGLGKILPVLILPIFPSSSSSVVLKLKVNSKDFFFFYHRWRESRKEGWLHLYKIQDICGLQREFSFRDFPVFFLICWKDESKIEKKGTKQMNQLTTWLIESNNIQKEAQMMQIVRAK